MRKILLGVVLLGGVACGNLPGVAAAPAFQIENANPDDTIAYTASAKQVVFDVTSPRGIGKAHILQTAGAAPEKLRSACICARWNISNFPLTRKPSKSRFPAPPQTLRRA